MPPSEQSSVRYRFGEFELRPDEGRLIRAGACVPIQPQPLKVLTLLVESAGRLVTRAELIAEIWGDDTHVDFDRGINYCVKQIRGALGDDAAQPRFVRTLPRLGYRFEAEVSCQPTSSASSVMATRGDRRLASLFALAASVVLLALLASGGTPRIAPRGVEFSRTDPRALRELARGRHLLERGTAEGASRSLEHFELAVAIDPGLARGHLALAEALMQSPGDPGANASRSRDAVSRALEIDPELAEAHAQWATLKLYYDWDWASADIGYRRAVELRPASAALHHRYARYLALRGRHEAALAHIETAMELDPVSTSLKADAGWLYFQARHFDEAARLCEVTLELDPENVDGLWCLLQAQRLAGRDARALGAARRLAARLEPNVVLTLDDLETFWVWYIEWLERHPDAGTPSNLGLAHLALGRTERALALFERAYRDRSSCLLPMATDPQLEPLRGDARFEALLAGLDLGG